jgi:hypothetical protein
MIAPSPKMSRKQELAIAALLREPTIHEAAEAVGIAPITLLRWLQVPTFRDSYRVARRQVVEVAIAQLQAATIEAVETLRKVMADDEAPASSRVSAARTALETAIRGIELLDLEARVERMERALDGRSSRNELERQA